MIDLIEDRVAELVEKNQVAKNDDADARDYKIINQWVETLLRWIIVIDSDRDEFQKTKNLKSERVEVSLLKRSVILFSAILNTIFNLMMRLWKLLSSHVELANVFSASHI